MIWVLRAECFPVVALLDSLQVDKGFKLVRESGNSLGERPQHKRFLDVPARARAIRNVSGTKNAGKMNE
jgi:hypothetical protein